MRTAGENDLLEFPVSNAARGFGNHLFPFFVGSVRRRGLRGGQVPGMILDRWGGVLPGEALPDEVIGLFAKLMGDGLCHFVRGENMIERQPGLPGETGELETGQDKLRVGEG